MHMRELWQGNYWIIKSRSQLHRSKFHTNSNNKFRRRNASRQDTETHGVKHKTLWVSTRIHIWCRVKPRSNLRCRNKLKKLSLKELDWRDQIPQSVLPAPVEDMETILEAEPGHKLKPQPPAQHLHKFQAAKEFHTTKPKETNNQTNNLR